MGWYASLVLIGVAGFGLIGYSRYEVNHPVTTTTTTTTTIGPSIASQWYVGLAFDICGKVSSLPITDTKDKAAGIKSLGKYILLIEPGSVPDPQQFIGNNATLQQFANFNKPTLKLSNTEVQLPGTNEKLWQNGDTCNGAPGKLYVKVWPTPASPTGTIVTNNPVGQKFQNGSMVTIAFVADKDKANIPSIPKAAISELEILYQASIAAQSTTTTFPVIPPTSTVVGPTLPSTSTTVTGGSTSTTAGGATSTTAPGATSTTAASSTSTTAGASTTTVASSTSST